MEFRAIILAVILTCLIMTSSVSVVLAMGPAGHKAGDVVSDSTSKPGSPVSVSMTPAGGAPAPGEIAELIIAMRSSVEADNATLTLKLTGGAQLLHDEGGGKQASWVLPLSKGEAVTKTVTVRFAEHPGSGVTAIIEIKPPGGGRYSDRASIKAGPAGAEAGKPSSKATHATDAKGRGIIEHRTD